MTWDTSRIGGPSTSAHVSGAIFVLPEADVSEALQVYAQPVLSDVPSLAGEACLALVFADEATAERVLGAHRI